MGAIWDRIDVRAGGPAVRETGTPLDEILRRLEGGESPRRVGEVLGLTPADLIAALAHAGLGEDTSGSPGLVRGAARRPRLAGALTEGAWVALLPDSPLPARLGLAAALLQIHDFWDASHHAAQQADDLGERHVSAYWHAIAHRREPDPGNASYWFRRVGAHPIFPPLASAARPLLDAHGDPSLTARLIQGGGWNPFAFVDLCTEAGRSTASVGLAREIQRLEMILLLESSATAATVAST
jgi:uncharacterized protein (DUF433 family)